jgi:hypothetical protein
MRRADLPRGRVTCNVYSSQALSLSPTNHDYNTGFSSPTGLTDACESAHPEMGEIWGALVTRHYTEVWWVAVVAIVWGGVRA